MAHHHRTAGMSISNSKYIYRCLQPVYQPCAAGHTPSTWLDSTRLLDERKCAERNATARSDKVCLSRHFLSRHSQFSSAYADPGWLPDLRLSAECERPCGHFRCCVTVQVRGATRCTHVLSAPCPVQPLTADPFVCTVTLRLDSCYIVGAT